MNNERKLIINVGAPGAGKSYVSANLYPDLMTVDCDRFKQSHPDYDPKNPGALHAWSSQEANRAALSALGAGESFVYDGTGTNVERMVNYINQAHACGYTVEILYVKVSLATALRRNSERARTVPENLVREKFSMIATSVDILSGYADNVRTVNND